MPWRFFTHVFIYPISALTWQVRVEEPAARAPASALLARLKGVVLPASRVSGSMPSTTAWLTVPPHDLLLV